MYLKNLLKIRNEKGWSQEKLSKLSGVSLHTLTKLENNRIKDPKISTIVKLADVFKIPIDKLLDR